MNKLKVRFMLIVCQFIGDWYLSQSADDIGREKRVTSLKNLMIELQDEIDTV